MHGVKISHVYIHREKNIMETSIKDGIREILDKSSVRSYALRKAEEEKRC